ncbi:hypothetical protein R6Q57_018147 [Mikania cordata]
MAAAHLTSTCVLPSFEGLRSSTSKVQSVVVSLSFRSLTLRSTRGLVVKSATTVAPKENDIVGILETDDVKDLKPLNDRVLIKVEEADETTAGGLLLT